MLRKKLVATVLIGMAMCAIAADPPHGVEPGETIPGPFNAYIVFGGPKAPPTDPIQTEERQNSGDASRAGKFHDLVTRYDRDPVVAIFVRDVPPADDQPLAQLIKWLDTTIVKNRTTRLHAFTIFLRLNNEFLRDEGRIPQINLIRDFATKLDLKETPLAIDQAESDRTKAFKIAADDQITVIIYNDHKVKHRFVFTAEKPLDEAAVKEIQAAVKPFIKK